MAVLNNTTVRRARPRARKYEITCSAVRGFVLRVLPSGKKVFLVRRHAGGQDERVRIGGAESMSCDEARVRAIELLEGRALTQRSPAPQPAAPAPTRGGRASVRTQPEPGEAPTLFAFAERYAREHVARHTKPKTQVRYRECIRLHLGPALGDVPLDEITPAAVESLHAAMSRTPSAANCTIHVLNHMYTKARDWGVLPHDHPPPTRTVRFYRERRRERFLTPEERAHLAAVLREGEATGPSKPGYIRWATAAAIRLLALTGMRKSEVLELKWSMIDARHQCLRLPDSKTGQKAVPVSSHVLELLDELRVHQRPDIPYVLYSSSGRPLHTSSVNVSWHKIRARAGLDDVRIHDLRHSAASDALMAGVPLEVVGKILGHTSVMTTARYAHLSDHVVKAAVESMGASIVAAESAGLTAKRRRRRRRSR